MSNEMQINQVSDRLRKRLWNNIVKTIQNNDNIKLTTIRMEDVIRFEGLLANTYMNLCKYLLDKTYGEIVQSIESLNGLGSRLQSCFLTSDWYKVYDCIEDIIGYFNKDTTGQSVVNYSQFLTDTDTILEEESSGYRIVSNLVSPIIEKEQREEIEKTLLNSPDVVRNQINNALSKLSDRRKPDYRNSIKESISAVESICRLILQDEDITLGRALDKIESTDKVTIHKHLKEAFKKMYHYTSDDKSGIRHGMMEDDNLDIEDARVMLVSCSAFINYLTVKTEKAGIDMNPYNPDK